MRIVVIRNELPWPLCSGGKLHAYELCSRLAQGGHARGADHARGAGGGREGGARLGFEWRVAGGSAGTDARWCAGEEGFSPPPRCSRVERFFGVDERFGAEVERMAREWGADVVLGMNYLSLPHLARIRGIPTVCDMGDDEVLHRWRELWSGWSGSRRADLKALLAGAVFERRYVPRVSAVTMLSRADQHFCRRLTGQTRVEFIPHGVDAEHYRPADQRENDQEIIFWGGLSFGPNAGAVRFFAKRVWPRIRRVEPAMAWTIVGRASGEQRAQLSRVPGVECAGFVEDIRPHVARAGVVVVPMVSGAGIKNKILEAWAMGKAVVCTPRALGSLPGRHGHNVWVARSPRDLAAGVVALSRDRRLRHLLGQAARRTVLEQCTWAQAAARLEGLCRELAAGRRARPGGARREAAGPRGVHQEAVSHAAT